MRLSNIIFSLILLVSGPSCAEEYDVPKRAKPYIKYCLKADNPSRECALTDQESAFNPFARSPYAAGLRQFTDATGKGLARTDCKHLGPYSRYDVRWQMECGIIYSQKLERSSKRLFPKLGYCPARYIAEQRYNGGFWVVWELREAKTTDLRKAHKVCGTMLKNGRKRAKVSCTENYEYPVRISMRQLNFESLGGEMCLESAR